MHNFWQKLNRPFSVLSPMEDVTDTVFRQIVMECGRPDVFMTEFVNCDGLMSRGRDKVIHRLQFRLMEKPLVAQIWGSHPETFTAAARLVSDMGFDGVDINMGCPQKNVVNNCAGGGLVGNYELAKEIIEAVKTGANGLPISVKTRLGRESLITTEWATFLLQQDIQALTIHGRLVKDSYAVSANWEEIAKVVEIRNQLKFETVIIGNGDVKNYSEGVNHSLQFGTDGFGIGRAIISNPWAFNKENSELSLTKLERLTRLLEHIKLFEQTWDTKYFAGIRKYFKGYLGDFPGAKEMRQELFKKESLSELKETVQRWIKLGKI